LIWRGDAEELVGPEFDRSQALYQGTALAVPKISKEHGL